MIRQPFGDNWSFSPRTSIFEHLGGRAEPVTVTVPHDALLTGGRSAESSGGAHVGYFHHGSWRYEKQFDAPASWESKRVTFEFEGVYRDARVFINETFAGHCANGYSTFYVAADPFLRPGERNTIRVEARTYKDSRWYSGGGIHRPVHLLIGELLHITPTGLRVTTPHIDDELTVVAVATDIVNEGTGTRCVDLLVEIREADGPVVASERGRATLLAGEQTTVRLRAYIERPLLWGLDEPNLYTATVRLAEHDGEVDDASTTFGIRDVSLDPARGLRLNGSPIKLRGACVHNDNGVLGAATFDRAEERRVQLLKAAGFNALRSAHNPMSRAMLDACDQLGMLVMDETWDNWAASKIEDDYAYRFPDWWERDIDALVAKDFNHPSVIFYSIGNEIPEAGAPHGGRWARHLTERIRSQDPTRFVTNAINGMTAAGDLIPGMIAEAQAQRETAETDAEPLGFNSALAQFTDVMEAAIALPLVGERLIEDAAVLDVLGLNYGASRYLLDRQDFPNRLVVGTETFPAEIDRYWKLVTDNEHVIGDFTWTGWDYLGETGIGRPVYSAEDDTFAAPYPWVLAHTGDIDITGRRRPISYYREIVFGLRTTPYLAVQRPEHHANPFKPYAWRWTDSVASWTWDVPDGSPITVEAYADADEVEFLVNGDARARVPVGDQKAFVATADLSYEPGRVEAVAYRDGAETGRVRLDTAAAPTRIRVTADSSAMCGDRDLVFLDIELVDPDGTVNPLSEQAVSVAVDGPGLLQGLGTARPSTEESFLASTCTTYQGHALAVLRGTGEEGDVQVTVRTEGLAPATITVAASKR